MAECIIGHSREKINREMPPADSVLSSGFHAWWLWSLTTQLTGASHLLSGRPHYRPGNRVAIRQLVILYQVDTRRQYRENLLSPVLGNSEVLAWHEQRYRLLRWSHFLIPSMLSAAFIHLCLRPCSPGSVVAELLLSCVHGAFDK